VGLRGWAISNHSGAGSAGGRPYRTASDFISALKKKKEKAPSIHVAVGKQHGGDSVVFVNSVFK